MKKLLLLFLIVFCGASFLLAQRTITGTITDNLGEPLIGATVLDQDDSSIGTTTDIDGTYSLDVAATTVGLIVSYTGFEEQTVALGTSNVVDVSLSEGVVLSEVVVTALGIEREERSLGFSVDQIESDELTKSRSTNIVNALQGKVTGVQIQSSSGNLGGSSKVIIRGLTSLSGRNSPLWVVDGIPINDNQFASLGTRISGNRDFGNGASVLNPDDIESMSILKGAAATALYGSRAAAGAIIVTSKKGGGGKKAKITINSTFRADNLFVVPDYQQQYAMGSLAKYDSSSAGFDWGPLIAGQTVNYLPITGETGPLTAVEDNGVKDFFETGYTAINNISVADGNENMDYRVSFGLLNQTGIVPGSSLDRYNISFNTGFKHNDKLESRFGVQVIKTESEGTAAAGANDPNIIGLGSFSSTLDQKDYQPWIDENGQQINQLTPTSNNPYWIRNENRNDRDDTRILANASLSYSPIDRLKFSAKVGYDFDQDNRFFSNRKGTAQRLLGDFNTDNINNIQLNTDIIGTYNVDLTADLTMSALVGYNYNQRTRTIEGLFGNELLIAELFSPGNASQTVPARDFREQTLYGVYGSFEFNYKNYLSLTVTGRNDWSSTLPKDNNSYFYPSASLAFVFTDAIKGLSGNSVLNFGKFRASYAEVGNDTDPYQLNFNFFPITRATGQYGLNVNFPFDGRLAFSKGNTIPPTGLRPEQQISWEVGAELDFLDSRIGLDFAYFNTTNKDQILNLPIPETTGFGFLTTNVGQVDTDGFEVTIDAVPVRSKNFRWNTLVNFSTSNVKIAKLAEGVDRVLIASAFNSVQVVAEQGNGFELLAVPFLRNDAGQPIINPINGTRQAGEARTMGSVLPDFTMGFVNSLQISDFSLSFTIDWREGGVMKSSTVESLQTGGLVEETLLNRNGTFIDAQGVLENPDGSFRPNDVPVRNAEQWWTAINDGSVAEPYIFDASFAKLREVRLDYTLPKSILGNSFIHSLTVGLEARNVALLYSKVPHIDPEANLFGSASDGFGIERATTPSTRSIGFNIRAQF